MGRALHRMTPEAIATILLEGSRFAVTANGLPRDAKVVNRAFDELGRIVLLIESAAYPETPDGGLYPWADSVQVTRLPDPTVTPAMAEDSAPFDEAVRAHVAAELRRATS
jgi:hypothetical protein